MMVKVNCSCVCSSCFCVQAFCQENYISGARGHFLALLQQKFHFAQFFLVQEKLNPDAFIANLLSKITVVILISVFSGFSFANSYNLIVGDR